MAVNNYSVVQTIENDEVLLSVLPSRWIIKNGWKQQALGGGHDGSDLCYWPKGVSGYRLLEKAKNDPTVPVDTKVLRAYQCKIKRNGFANYPEAFRESKLMEAQSDTDEYEPKKKLSKSSTAADLFRQIQSKTAPRPGPSCLLRSTNFAEDHLENTVDVVEDTSDLDESFLKPSGQLGTRVVKMHNAENAPLSQPLRKEGNSDTGLTTPLHNATIDHPSLLQLVLSLHEKVDNNTQQIENCVENVKISNNRNTALLSQVNAKLDVIATQAPQPGHPECFEVKKNPLNPVKCLADMESLEEKSKNDQFVRSVVQFLGAMHGKQRYVGEGSTVCLQIIDCFFGREFLVGCSWSGISRNKQNENIISKIPFHKYGGVIDLFHKVVQYSDPTFSKVQSEQFLHRCLRNAKQRFEEIKGTRAPVARKRVKVKYEPTGIARENLNDGEEIIVEEFVIEPGQTTSPNQPGYSEDGSQVLFEEFIAE